jgi:RNA polymerase sigma factor (sigma-70 family)
MAPDLATLVSAAAAGDAGAWDTLVDRFASIVWSATRTYRLSPTDAEDVNQTVWLRLVENLDRIREPERLAGWLATTARNECFRVLRRRGRETPEELDDEWTSSVDDLDAGLLSDERDAALVRAFRSLPARCQELLTVLLTDPPPSYEEVATALEMPIGSIGPTRQRCLQRLRAHSEIVRISGSSSGSEGVTDDTG